MAKQAKDNQQEEDSTSVEMLNLATGEVEEVDLSGKVFVTDTAGETTVAEEVEQMEKGKYTIIKKSDFFNEGEEVELTAEMAGIFKKQGLI